jgi:hypothetical protein
MNGLENTPGKSEVHFDRLRLVVMHGCLIAGEFKLAFSAFLKQLLSQGVYLVGPQ